MDEENKEKTSEYTGEYGNAVEAGEDSQSSIYSYSYRDHHSEATSSGDYRASEHSGGAWAQNNGSRTDEPQQQEAFSDNGNGQYSYQHQQPEGNTGWQNPFQNGSQGEPFQQSPGGNGFYGNPNEQSYHNSDMPKKSSGITWKKVGACAGLAIVFGIVAAICFQGVCLFSSHVLGINVSALDMDIAYTTDNVNYTKTITNTAIGMSDVSGIAQNTMPSVVAITSTEDGEDYYDLFGQYYRGQETTSCGSGFIVGKNDTELLIVTNNHVIDGAKTISVQFIDDEVYEASAKGKDSSADLAVIAVKLTDIKSSTLKKIKVATLGDSSEAKVGEMVIAIGNALGYGQSVTVGYISAKDREIAESSESEGTIKVIQTDAAINPGNSGGALLNMRGEVVGINSAKIADSAVEGVGYAIPISEATPIIDELMNKEVLTDDQKGYLGISCKTVSEEAASFNMPEGVYVAEVAEGGAADKAGIIQGDIITAINDVKVTTNESLKEKANSYKKGTTVTITIQRNDNGTYQEQKVDVTLQGQDSLDSLPDSTTDSSGGSSGDNGNGRGNNGSDNGNGDDGYYGNGDGSGDDYYDGWGNFPFGFGN